MNTPSLIRMLKRSIQGFTTDDVMTLSASLSFYTLLSFAPLTILAMWVAAELGPGAQEKLLEQMALVAGSNASDAAKAVIESAEDRPTVGSMAGITGILVSLVGATTVFARLQNSLNAIWNIDAKPGNAIWSWLRRRVLSLGVIAAVGFVLIVSLILSAAMGLFLNNEGVIWVVINQVASAVVLAGLFMLLFRYLPDARLPWHYAIRGGAITAILFGIGKTAIGIYLSRASIGGAYGAAGSIVLLMVWVYYSSAIFLFGAEFIQAWMNERGLKIPSAEHAEKIPVTHEA